MKYKKKNISLKISKVCLFTFVISKFRCSFSVFIAINTFLDKINIRKEIEQIVNLSYANSNNINSSSSSFLIRSEMCSIVCQEEDVNYIQKDTHTLWCRQYKFVFFYFYYSDNVHISYMEI